MGIAIGNIGMSYDDFMWADFEEFQCIYDAWRESQEELARDEWERARTVAFICIGPYVSKNTSVKDILHLPWDNETESERNAYIGKEEAKSRLIDIMKKSAQNPK